MKHGIDVSKHNPFTEKQYAAIAPNIDFVILREGYRQTMDELVATHVNGFKKNGVPIIGFYHFIYALDNASAKKEAASCIKNVEKLGFGPGTRIWADFEYDTLDNAKNKGVILTPKECNQFTETFCEAVKAAGYVPGIYTNNDFYQNWYSRSVTDKYDLWLADYTGGPDHECLIQQDGERYVNGYNDTLDCDIWFDEKEGTPKNDVKSVIDSVISLALQEVGYKEKASPKGLYDKEANAGSNNYTKYNYELHNLQPSNMDYPAAWCDAFVDWLFYKLFGADKARDMLCGDFDDYTVISADYYKKAGRWDKTPERGHQIFFKNNSGICHTGIVYRVANGNVYTVEGNKNNMVKTCIYNQNDASIAGYGMPVYWIASDIEIYDGVSYDDWKPIGTATCTGNDVNVRGTPGGVVLSQLYTGNRFEIDGKTDGKWVHMKRTDINEIGWIYMDYVKPDSKEEKSVHDLAMEVLEGKWGNTPDRKIALEAAGYNYYAVQKEVNKILGY